MLLIYSLVAATTLIAVDSCWCVLVADASLVIVGILRSTTTTGMAVPEMHLLC